MLPTFTEKLKESAVSVIPVMVIVLILHFSIAPLQNGQMPQFVLGGILLIIGLTIFLIGADLGMVPFGQKVGSSLTHQRSLLLILGAAFAIGFAITIAEPDVQVLANQVNGVNPAIRRGPLLMMIAGGVGVFLVVAMLRTILQIPLRWLLLGFYILVFIACTFVDPSFVAMAFDAGGATTGPITVPFIMAMGIGVAAAARKKEGDDSSFGMVGLASIGPIAAVAFMGMITPTGAPAAFGGEESAAAQSLLAHFMGILPETTQHIALALAPLLVIFLFFQVTLLHLPVGQLKRMLFGFAYAFIGLVLFMTGVNGGFSPAGKSLGMALGVLLDGWALLPIGCVLGAVVVCAEPAVWVLTEQVEEVSGGHIRRPIMMAALCISIAAAVVLGMLRVVTGLSIWYIIVPGYILALGLTFFCPRLFSAIAFDSGGVASGPMSTTFVLSLALGASSVIEGGNPATDAFGMIAMIAMAPLITIQLLGLIFKRIEKKQQKKTGRQRDEPSIQTG